MDALIPGIDPESIGDWKILYRISASNNSIIYFASRGREGREEAAIKVLSHDVALDSSTIERLRVEVDALRQLNNPHIAKLLDYDLDTVPAWIATEYLGRKSLEIKLRQDQTPVTGIYWWELARSIFSGLSAIHSVNITHRDIKPANIMIDKDMIKIIDFGISYVPGNSEVITRNSLEFEGSRLFASPENYRNKFTPKMDVFSAAVTLAYAARLKSIWDEENEDTLSESIVKGIPDLSNLEPEQIELISPLLDKFASQRPTSEEALNKVHEYIEHFANKNLPKPIPLRGSSWIYRLVRKRSFRIVLALILLTLMFALVVTQDPKTIYIQEKAQDIQANSSTEGVDPEVVKPSQSTSALCEESFQNNSKDVAQYCLEPANAGDIRSMYYLGYYEEKNNNMKSAESWFLKAAQRGDAASMERLVQVYIDTRQTEKQKIWVKRCADLSTKIQQVGRCKLIYGLDQVENGTLNNKGLLYVKDAYDYGDQNAATVLGAHYNALKDYENALRWWERAAEIGDKTGTDYLIRVANKLGKKELVNKWLKISADNGNPQHAWMYAMEFVLQEDYKTAKKYALIGANGGDLNAMGILGLILWKSDRDIKQAKVWLNRAAKDNNISAINFLGDISAQEDKDYIQALEWYKKSEKLGSLQGGFYVGAIHYEYLQDNAAACTAFKNVLIQTEKLKKSLRYEDDMEQWVVKSSESIPYVCAK